MKLYINTSDSEKILIRLDDIEFTADSRREKAQRLLPFINESLVKKSAKLTDLSEIEVYTDSGSFTGIRVGVSIANALGWSLGIPVNGKKPSREFTQINYTSTQ